MKFCKYLAYIVALIIVASLNAESIEKEDCSFQGLGFDEGTNVAAVYFYTGTCHYRNKDYQQSADSWEQLGQLEDVDLEFKALQTDVLNNLGYLMFYGLGINENKAKALKYWEKAALSKHSESTYFLCTTYSDKGGFRYRPKRALKHCKSAESIFAEKDVKDNLVKERIIEISEALQALE